MRTLGQRRAKDALDKANAVVQRQPEFQREYRSYIDRLAPAILMNGLGQAMAMELSAAGTVERSPHRLVHDHLSSWLCHNQYGVYRGQPDLLDALMVGPQEKYLLAQAEALQWLEWHKRFCRAKLSRGEEG